MVRDKLGPACKEVEVNQGLQGAQRGTTAPYRALAHLLFESVEAFERSFGPHAQAIQADITNYTTIEPVIQISEIKTQG